MANNTIFRFDWYDPESTNTYRLDIYGAGDIAITQPDVVYCNHSAITDFKCDWEYEDGVPLGLGSLINMKIDFKDSLLPVELSNLLTAEMMPIAVPMSFTNVDYRNGATIWINTSDNSTFNPNLNIACGNIFIFSRVNTNITGGYETLAVSMQKNSDSYEWDVKDGVQSIETTNIGRVVLESIKLKCLEDLPVYRNLQDIAILPSYVDYIGEHIYPNAYRSVIYVGGCLPADGDGTDQTHAYFIFIDMLYLHEYINMIASKLFSYYLRLPVDPSISDGTYGNIYYKQTYNDFSGVRGEQAVRNYLLATVIGSYDPNNDVAGRDNYFMHGGACYEMQDKYKTAWDYYSDNAKNRFVRSNITIAYQYPLKDDTVGTWAIWNPNEAFIYNSAQAIRLTTELSDNMIYEPKLKVRDKVINKCTSAPPETCTQDIGEYTRTNPASWTEKTMNIPIIFNNVPAAGDDGFTGDIERREGWDDIQEQRFNINNLDSTTVRYSWATFHAFQRFYLDQPILPSYGQVAPAHIAIRVHEKMKFQISDTKSSDDFATIPDMDFTSKQACIGQDEYIYVQNNSGEGVIKAQVALALFGNANQCTITATMRLSNSIDWFLPNCNSFYFRPSELAPDNNPDKFNNLPKYYVPTKAEIDIKAGTVEFELYGNGEFK